MFSKPISVSTLTENLKTIIQSNFSQVIVSGELSNISLQNSGHFYFAIKDDQAVLQGVFFNFKTRFFDRKPQNGDAVILHGKLTVYPPRGQYQIVVSALLYAGTGNLLLTLEERKKRLAAQGFFDLDKKKQLPANPKTIGIITSPTGAVIQDILRVLSRRCHHFKAILHPVTVQGNCAVKEMCQAIHIINQYQLADVIILARGGGSIEDLWSFNEEALVIAISQSVIPIISAVGHETDYTLSDLVADVRAPTPSAAAEIVSIHSEKKHQILQNFLSHTQSHAKQFIQTKKIRLFNIKKHLQQADFHLQASQKLDFISLTLQRQLLNLTGSYHQKLYTFKKTFSKPFVNQSSLKIHQINRLLYQNLDLKIREFYKLYDQIRKNIYLETKISSEKATLQKYKTLLKQSLVDKLYLLSSLTQNYKTQFNKNIENTRLYLQQDASKMYFIKKRLESALNNKILSIKKNAYQQKISTHTSVIRLLSSSKTNLESLKEQLSSLSPKNVLKRGYSMLFNFNQNSAIISVKDLNPENPVKAVLADGAATFVVSEINTTI